jgi:hypothetical protein
MLKNALIGSPSTGTLVKIDEKIIMSRCTKKVYLIDVK